MGSSIRGPVQTSVGAAQARTVTSSTPPTWYGHRSYAPKASCAQVGRAQPGVLMHKTLLATRKRDAPRFSDAGSLRSADRVRSGADRVGARRVSGLEESAHVPG